MNQVSVTLLSLMHILQSSDSWQTMVMYWVTMVNLVMYCVTMVMYWVTMVMYGVTVKSASGNIGDVCAGFNLTVFANLPLANRQLANRIVI